MTVSAEQPNGGVLSMTVTNNFPSMESEPVYFKTSNYKYLHMRLRNFNSDSGAYFRWLRVGDSSYKTVAPITTSTDGQWHQYRVDLSAIPEWTGTVTKLRFEPLHTSDGANFDIDWIRLTD